MLQQPAQHPDVALDNLTLSMDQSSEAVDCLGPEALVCTNGLVGCSSTMSSRPRERGSDELYQQDSVSVGNRCKFATSKGQDPGFFNLDVARSKRSRYYDKTLAKADCFFVEIGWLRKMSPR